MRTFLIILPIIIWALQVNGQIGTLQKTEDIGFEIAKRKHLEFNKGEKHLTENEIGGSPYLDKEFQECYILRTNGTEIKDTPLRYNIYKNNMEFKKDGKVLEMAVPSEIQRINMGGKVFIYTQYMSPKIIKSGFFQVLYEGDFQLLKKYQVALNSTSEKTESSDSLSFKSRSPQFFLRYRSGMAHIIYSQETLIKRLQPISQDIINYIKSKKISGREETQLIELMEHIEDTPH